MAKMIRVECCASCPNLFQVEEKDYCDHKRKELPGSLQAIPNWCPLPDAPEPVIGVDPRD